MQSGGVTERKQDLSMMCQVQHMKYTQGIPRAGAGRGSELDAGAESLQGRRVWQVMETRKAWHWRPACDTGDKTPVSQELWGPR